MASVSTDRLITIASNFEFLEEFLSIDRKLHGVWSYIRK